MQEIKAPENLKIYRKKGRTALGGILFVLFAATLMGLVTIAYLQTGQVDKETGTMINMCFAAAAVFSAISLICAALCFNNLRFPLILATDEKGIYDYSGYVHSGFIPWEDIERINGCSAAEAILDAITDGTIYAVRIDLKNYKRTFASKSGFWRCAYFFSGFGCTKIRTLCSPLSKKKTYRLLSERLKYYTTDQTTGL